MKKVLLVLALAVAFVGCEKEQSLDCKCGIIEGNDFINACSGNSIDAPPGYEEGEKVCTYNMEW